MTETRPWNYETDETPGDYLIGHLSGKFVGDDDSLQFATEALMAATFVRAGLTPDQAIDAVEKTVREGTHVKIALVNDGDGNSTLSFEFEQDEEE